MIFLSKFEKYFKHPTFKHRNKKCTGILTETKPFFANTAPVLLIVHVVEGKDIEPHEIPFKIKLDDQNIYFLIAISLNKDDFHYYLKLFDGNNFYDFNNLESSNGLCNNEISENWEISFAFYQKSLSLISDLN